MSGGQLHVARLGAGGGRGARARARTLRSSALHAFSSMAFCTRVGLVTSRSSPTIWQDTPSSAVILVYLQRSGSGSRFGFGFGFGLQP